MIDRPVIEIKNISKKYKSAQTYALDQVSLSINKTDIFGILGPNGAGKTTLISILCGITACTAGETGFYTGSGQLLDTASRKQLIGFVPQEYAFYEELSARQNLDYFGAMYNLSQSGLRERREHLLGVLGLTHVADNKVETYSGGMKRRLNLAIGIIHNPAFLFLDEPTVGVDVQSKAAILRYLIELNKDGTTIVYTSHHLSEAEAFCNRIALIDHGHVVAEGETKVVLQQHNLPDLHSLFIHLTGEAYRD